MSIPPPPSAFPPSSTDIYGDLPHRAGPGAHPGVGPCRVDWGSEASSKSDLGGGGGGPNPCDNPQGGEALPPASPLPKTRLTVLLVEGVVAQAQGGPAPPTLEAAAMEEVSLGTGSLQDVDTAAAEVASVAALPAGRRLQGKRTGCGGTGVLAPTLSCGFAGSPGGLGRGGGFSPLAEVGLGARDGFAGTSKGAASLGSGKPVGSGNRQGGAGSLWAFACTAPVPALGSGPPAAGAPQAPTHPQLDSPTPG